MTRVQKTGAVAFLVSLIVGFAVWSADAARLSLQMQGTGEAITEVGSGPLGERALAMTGRGAFNPESIELYGYLTSVGGLGPADLFIDSSRSERTARFTFVADLLVESTENRADVTVTTAAGALRIYLDEAARAEWTDVASFADGALVAEYSLELRDTLHRQAPGVGLVVGAGQMEQSVGEEFTIGGERFQFGHANLGLRPRYVGALAPGSQSGQSYAVGLTGSAGVSDRESMIVSVGGPDSVAADATPAVETDLCSQLEPWLTQTRSGLARVRAIESTIAVDGGLAALDAGELRQAAEEVAGLFSAQREIDVPGEAAAANRLVGTALSTFVRGLETVADAAEAQDDDLLTQGQAALADGSNLIGRAEAAASTTAEDCAAGIGVAESDEAA